MRIWTPEHVRTFLEAERDAREYPIWRLALATGARRSEILGLPWTAVDLEAGRVTFHQSLVNVDAKPVLRKTTKTKSGRRLIHLDPRTVAVLRKHEVRQKEELLRIGITTQPELVFVDETGEWLRPERITRTFNARVKVHGLDPIRFHDMRHTFAGNLLREGVNVKVVSERLGHGDIVITLSTYAHTIPTQDEEVATIVAAMFG